MAVAAVPPPRWSRDGFGRWCRGGDSLGSTRCGDSRPLIQHTPVTLPAPRGRVAIHPSGRSLPQAAPPPCHGRAQPIAAPSAASPPLACRQQRAVPTTAAGAATDAAAVPAFATLTHAVPVRAWPPYRPPSPHRNKSTTSITAIVSLPARSVGGARPTAVTRHGAATSTQCTTEPLTRARTTPQA